MILFVSGVVAIIAWLLLRALLVLVFKRRFQKHWQDEFQTNTPDNAVVLVLFGDSISQGVGATRTESTFAGRVAAYIAQATGRPVKIKNYSRSGATADQVLTQVLAADLHDADLILLEVGANDTFRRTVDEYRVNTDKVIGKLPLQKTVIADLPYVKIRVPYQQALEALLEGKNVARAKASTSFKGFLASLPVTAGDFFHPNNKGYGLWFDAFKPGIDDVLRRHSLLKVEK